MAARGRATGRLGRRLRTLLTASLAASALIAATAGAPDSAGARGTPATSEFFGVVPVGPVDEQDFARMAETGVGTLRAMVFWPSVEPAPGSFNWGSFDYLVANAAKYGIRVFPTLYGTPGWANFLSGNDRCGSTCAPEAAAGRAAFGSFARAAVERYGPGGDFWTGSGGDCVQPILCPSEPPACACSDPLPIHSWQIWNEQNSPKYYRPAPSPAAYAKLVGAAAGQIRAVDPDAEIVLGGMWGPPTTDAVMPTATYLKRLYAVPGVEATFDAIAVHPYSPTLTGVTDQIRRVRQVARRAGDSRAGTWITELGWASGGPRSVGLVKTPKGQARLLDRSFRALIAKRRVWRIRGITWYSWRDAAPGQSDCVWCPRAGLRTRMGGEKPAARAFKRLALASR